MGVCVMNDQGYFMAKYIFLTHIWFKECNWWLNLRLKIRCVHLGIFNLKCLLIAFVIPNLRQINFCIQISLKPMFKTGFWIQNHLWNLCSRIVNSQRLFCSQKADVECSYLGFLIYLKGTKCCLEYKDIWTR